MSRSKQCKSTLICRRKPTSEEREQFVKMIAKERQKRERDLRCGGISDDGCYVRLHDRCL